MNSTLFADIGNTTVSWAVWSGSAWAGPRQVRPAASAPVALRAAARQAGASAVVAVVSSPANGSRVEEAIRADGLEFQQVRRDFPIPIQTAYLDPSQLGADRLCNALAASHLLGTPVVSASAGTCLTVEAVDASGVLAGGAIAAGVATAAAGIGLRVPHLTDPARAAAQRPPDRPAPGRTTEENLRYGLWLSAAATMDAFLAMAREAVGQGAPAVVTGGDAKTISSLMQTAVRVEPDLTLIGVKLAFDAAQP